jgi:hypothetical protein
MLAAESVVSVVGQTHLLTQPKPDRDKCLFCSAHLLLGRSKEHVLPQWLLEHLNIGDIDISPTHFTSQGTARSTRRHKLEALQEGRVCTNCNTGWMSRLEVDCKAILTPVFAEARSPADLSSEDRFRVARWTAKTAYVLNSASNFDQVVPLEHYSMLRDNPSALPTGVLVVAQEHDGEKSFSWWQGAAWQIEGQDLSGLESLQARTYKTSFQLGRLLLSVAWWPHPGWLFSLWRGVHIPFWPERGRVAYFDPIGQEFPWNDSDQALATFHIALGLRQDLGDR